MRAIWRTAAWWGWLGLCACVEYEKPGEAGGDPGPGPGSAPDPSGDPSSEPPDPSGAAETAEPTTGGGVAAECSLWDQDCPAGSKCMPYDSDSDQVVDDVRCVPLAGSPGQAGDTCQVEGSPASGLDDCDLGNMCWFLDELSQGTCVSMCAGPAAAPECPDGLMCDVTNDGLLLLCVATCDPLAPSCPMGQICIGTASGLFVCDADASGDQGGYGDGCTYVNVCDPGLLCVGSEFVPGCEAPGCCTPFCDLAVDEAQCPDAAQECQSYYQGQQPPPGYEDVGVCAVPQ